MPLRDLFVTSVFLAGLLGTFVQPIIGLGLWTVFTYGAPHRSTWSFAHDLPFVMLAAIATLSAMLLQQAWRIPPMRAPGKLFMVLMVWCAITTAAAYDVDVALQGYIQAVKIAALALVTAFMVRDRQTFMIVTTCLCASILFYGVKGGLFVLATGGQHLVFGPPGHFMEANNGLGVAMLMMLPIAWFLATEAENKWLRWGWLAAIPVSMLAIISTYSRGSALALGCMGLYWLFSSGHKKIALVLVALAPVVVFSFMPDQFIDRLQTIRTYDQDPSALQRLEMWGFGYRIALDRPFGGGFGIFPNYELYDDYGVDKQIVTNAKTAHSIYFEVLGQHGFIGLVLFLGMWVALFLSCGNVLKTYESLTARNFAIAVRISLVGYATGGAFVNKAFEWPISFQLLGLFLAAAAIFAAEGNTETQLKGVQRRAARLRSGTRPKARPGVGRPARSTVSESDRGSG